MAKYPPARVYIYYKLPRVSKPALGVKSGATVRTAREHARTRMSNAQIHASHRAVFAQMALFSITTGALCPLSAHATCVVPSSNAMKRGPSTVTIGMPDYASVFASYIS